jgi:hypothetical protein
MEHFPPALPHGPLEEIFPDVFFVSGVMETVLQEMDWKFSRNMTVVRDGERLIILNSIRLNEEGLAALERLGEVTDIIRLGALHGRDDAFYVERYKANYWTLAAAGPDTGISKTHTLTPDALPISDASLFVFETAQLPEAIIRLERSGGILIACDALQNWHGPDEYFSEESNVLMQSMGFFTPANIGPVWLQAATPEMADFERLNQLQYRHVLCGHGAPLKDTAPEAYSVSFKRIFSA